MSPFFNHLFLNVFYRLPVVACCAFLFWQSSYPGVISEPLFLHDDKVMHFTAYAFLAFLVVRDLIVEKTLWSLTKIKIIAIVFSSLYGLSDEIHQMFVPQRTASVWDLVADCTGSVAGCLFYIRFVVKKRYKA